MSVVEHGYQTYQMWNMYDEGSNVAEMASIVIDSNSNANHLSSHSPDGSMTIDLQGNFSINGSSLADVTGTLTDFTVTRNGELFFSDHYSNGADWQSLMTSFSYGQSLLSGNDTFIGSSAADINDNIQSLGGNDVFEGFGDTVRSDGSIGDKFFGGAGIDTAVYRGNLSEYSLDSTTIADGRNQSYQPIGADTVRDSVGNRDGYDQLIDVERLRFADTNVALDVGHGENAGMAYRMYKAAFDRVPDAEGLGFWINALDQGYSLEQISNVVTTTPEFMRVYGENSSNHTFVNLLYQHVLHREADTEGFNFWNDALNAGYSRGAVLAVYTETPENLNQTAPLVANGIQYQEWLG